MAYIEERKNFILVTSLHRIAYIRVLIGKVTTCLFDKTGTITTDELVAAGVVHPSHNGTHAIAISIIIYDMQYPFLSIDTQLNRHVLFV